jgi:hypothetical protein
MKYRTNQERRKRKEMKAMGTWPVSKETKAKESKLFACEKVLADAKLSISYLLENALNAKLRTQLMFQNLRTRQPYWKLSDPKKKKKSYYMFPLAKKEN